MIPLDDVFELIIMDSPTDYMVTLASWTADKIELQVDFEEPLPISRGHDINAMNLRIINCTFF